MKKLLREMFSEDNGNVSCMRILATIIILTVLFNWTYYNIVNDEIAAFEFSDIVMLLGVIGGKIVQKKLEK